MADEWGASLSAVPNRAGRIKFLQFSHAFTAEKFFQADGILRKSRDEIYLKGRDLSEILPNNQ